MFNNYYVFNKEVDGELRNLGFELNRDSLNYEKICQVYGLVVKYEIAKDKASAKRLNVPVGVCAYEYVNKIENDTLDEILGKAMKSLFDLNEQSSSIIEYYDLNKAISDCSNLRYIEVNSTMINSFNEVKEIKALDSGDKQFAYIKLDSGIEVYLNEELEDSLVKVYY